MVGPINNSGQDRYIQQAYGGRRNPSAGSNPSASHQSVSAFTQDTVQKDGSIIRCTGSSCRIIPPPNKKEHTGDDSSKGVKAAQADKSNPPETTLPPVDKKAPKDKAPSQESRPSPTNTPGDSSPQRPEIKTPGTNKPDQPQPEKTDTQQTARSTPFGGLTGNKPPQNPDPQTIMEQARQDLGGPNGVYDGTKNEKYGINNDPNTEDGYARNAAQKYGAFRENDDKNPNATMNFGRSIDQSKAQNQKANDEAYDKSLGSFADTISKGTDINGDGTITREEFLSHWDRNGEARSMAEKMANNLGLIGNNQMDTSKFTDIMKKVTYAQDMSDGKRDSQFNNQNAQDVIRYLCDKNNASEISQKLGVNNGSSQSDTQEKMDRTMQGIAQKYNLNSEQMAQLRQIAGDFNKLDDAGKQRVLQNFEDLRDGKKIITPDGQIVDQNDSGQKTANQSTDQKQVNRPNTFKSRVLEASKHKPIAVEFTMQGCKPCKEQAIELNETRATYGSDSVIRLDKDKNADLAARYGAKSFPTTLIFRNGKVVSRFDGWASKDAIDNAMKRAL